MRGQRLVLEALIERVAPHRLGHGRIEAVITWTALGNGLRALAGACGPN